MFGIMGYLKCNPLAPSTASHQVQRWGAFNWRCDGSSGRGARASQASPQPRLSRDDDAFLLRVDALWPLFPHHCSYFLTYLPQPRCTAPLKFSIRHNFYYQWKSETDDLSTKELTMSKIVLRGAIKS